MAKPKSKSKSKSRAKVIKVDNAGYSEEIANLARIARAFVDEPESLEPEDRLWIRKRRLNREFRGQVGSIYAFRAIDELRAGRKGRPTRAEENEVSLEAYKLGDNRADTWLRRHTGGKDISVVLRALDLDDDDAVPIHPSERVAITAHLSPDQAAEIRAAAKRHGLRGGGALLRLFAIHGLRRLDDGD